MTSYDIDEIPPAKGPSVKHDIRRAKKFLQKHSTQSGDSLYDHLTELLQKILSEQPENAVDVFEEYSRKLKEERLKMRTDHLRDIYVPPPQYEDAKKFIQLIKEHVNITASNFNNGEEDALEEEEEENERRIKIPNMLDLLFYFEQAGVGLPRAEMVSLNVAIRKLIATAPLENVRFWGKILGNPRSYYIVEGQLRKGELGRRLKEELAQRIENNLDVKSDVAEEVTQAKAEENASVEGKTYDNISIKDPLDGSAIENLAFNATSTTIDSIKYDLPPLPKNLWKPPVEVPPEKIGTGVNEKVYFVSNSPRLDDWIELPSVTPQQIVVARQIIRYFTGDLENPVRSFPPFPGTEKNYLRAQIARISAATHISPTGFYTFGEGIDEEEIDEELQKEDRVLSENVHYDSLPVKDLVDPTLSNWCHHVPYILTQGRTTWWSSRNAEESIDDEELEEREDQKQEEEEEEEDNDDTKTDEEDKEIGPPLLTPLSADDVRDFIIPWTVRLSSYIQPDNAIAFVRSNTWPGAVAFATGRRFGNVYIGWGHKHNAYNYSPPDMPPVQDQYPIGPEITELTDPIVEEEQAYRMAHSTTPRGMSDDEDETILGGVGKEEDNVQ